MDKRRILIDFDDVIELCGSAATSRGQAYKAGKRVRALEFDADSNRLFALVSGSENAEPYSQTIDLTTPRLRGNCSCPVGVNCKHVAAVLLTWIDHQHKHQGAEAHDPEMQAVDRWLRDLIESSEHLDQPKERNQPGELLLFYQLDLSPVMHGREAITLSILQSRLLKRGGYGKESPYRYHSHYHHPHWVLENDRAILDLLVGRVSNYNYLPLIIEGGIGHLVMEKLLGTGRCFWGSQRQHPLTRSSTRQLVFNWQKDTAERHRLTIDLSPVEGDDGSEWQLIDTDPPWYLIPGHANCGPIEQAPPIEILSRFMKSPPIPDEHVQAISNYVASRLPSSAPPMPVPPDFVTVDEPPTPILALQSRDDSPDPRDYFASIKFRYGTYVLPYEGEKSDSVLEGRDDNGNMLVLKRHIEAEREHVIDFSKRFEDFEPANKRDAEFFSVGDRAPATRDVQSVLQCWRALLAREEELKAAGWRIEVHQPFDLEFETVTRLHAELGETGSNWFDMALKLEHDGERYDLLPLVVEWLEHGTRDEPLLMQAVSGQWLEIPPTLIRPVANTLLELYDEPPSDGLLRLPRQRALDVEALADEWQDDQIEVQWRGAEQMFALADRLRQFEGIERATMPDSIKAEMRPYQLDGLAWLNFLAEYGFNGILADDMGLGKTLQTLAHIADQKERGTLTASTLIVAPTSLLGNWQREINRFLPSATSAIWHGSQRDRRELSVNLPDIVITSYSLVTRDFDFLDTLGFGLVVLDEAQAIKNPGAKITKTVKRFAIERRLCLTGTPLENHLGELWSQFDFLMPGFLGTRKFFTRHFRTPIENHGSDERQQRLSDMIRPFLLRRRKEAVATELPPKTEIIREVDLHPTQAKLYESIRVSMEKRVRSLLAERGLARSHIELLDALLKLRQTCCHPDLVKLDSARDVHESAKTDMLMSMLEELVDEGKKVLLFSQFTEMLALIEEQVKARNLSYVKLTGRTRKRTEVIDAFQLGDVPLFLISLKAGGTGLNLTAADTVIHYDPWWNPAVEAQASDRAHRIGQDKPVFVYKLVASDTVEEKIVAMQAQKKQLADQTLEQSDTAALKGLSADDVLDLFSGPDPES